MSGLELEDGLRTLLTTQLDSFEKLEIVRVLRAAGQAMSAEALESACRCPSQTVREALEELERGAIIEQADGGRLVRLGPGSKRPHFEALMQLYEEDRPRVMSVLSSLAMERIRTMAARAFADAFLIRTKRGDNDG